MTDFGMGWLPDYPDFRDYTAEHKKIAPLMQKADLLREDASGLRLGPHVDLREKCPPIENQGNLGSCTANAAVGIVEYFERAAFGRHIDASRLFLYKATRDMMHKVGDTGAHIRTAMGALVLFGVPPEEYWPYKIEQFDEEPPSFCYAFAQNYKTINYYRLDPPNLSVQEVLVRVKAGLAAGIPSMFGFTVYDSIREADTTGEIPFPAPREDQVGGHAVVAVGYDDNKKIKNAEPDTKPTVGAFLIRNSWGTSWGDRGYGWLPFEYILKGLAVDWWSLLKSEWIDTGVFKLR